MTFEIPSDLAPEAYPLAWLLGSWSGSGELSHEDIETTEVIQNLTFDHDGGPYLRFTSTIYAHNPALSAPQDNEKHYDVWSTETGYWRIMPEQPADIPAGLTAIECLIADPAGRVSVLLGTVGNGRVDLSSDLIARTQSATEVTAVKRMYGNVAGQLLWVEEIAAFGKPLQNYLSLTLDRA